MYLDQIPSGGEHARNFSGKRLDPTVFEKVPLFLDSSQNADFFAMNSRCLRNSLDNYMS